MKLILAKPNIFQWKIKCFCPLDNGTDMFLQKLPGCYFRMFISSYQSPLDRLEVAKIFFKGRSLNAGVKFNIRAEELNGLKLSEFTLCVLQPKSKRYL